VVDPKACTGKLPTSSIIEPGEIVMAGELRHSARQFLAGKEMEEDQEAMADDWEVGHAAPEDRQVICRICEGNFFPLLGLKG
jgi:hypothetical protein